MRRGHAGARHSKILITWCIGLAGRPSRRQDSHTRCGQIHRGSIIGTGTGTGGIRFKPTLLIAAVNGRNRNHIVIGSGEVGLGRILIARGRDNQNTCIHGILHGHRQGRCGYIWCRIRPGMRTNPGTHIGCIHQGLSGTTAIGRTKGIRCVVRFKNHSRHNGHASMSTIASGHASDTDAIVRCGCNGSRDMTTMCIIANQVRALVGNKIKAMTIINVAIGIVIHAIVTNFIWILP